MAGRTRGAGVDVVPGRVRLARETAKMSLAQVTRGDISRTALHLIEIGKSRPSLRTLELIAKRTGKPLEYFLPPGGAEKLVTSSAWLHDLELALAQGRFDEAKQTAKSLLESTRKPLERGQLCLLGAQAHLQTASVDGALSLLIEARSIYEAAGATQMLAECLDWQAAAEHLLELPSAYNLARQALGLAKSLDPTPDRLLVRIYGRIASICVAQHRWQEAIGAYQEAVAVGRGLLDMNRMAKMYNDLSIAHRRLSELDQAREYAHKAVAIHEVLNDALSIGRAETNLALIMIRQDQPDAAAMHLERALSIFEGANQKRGRAHILLAQAELLVRRGDLVGAQAKASEAHTLAAELEEKATVSEAKQILATLAALEGNAQESDRLFNEAIALLEGMGLAERLTTLRATYASLLEKRGDVQGALAQWRLAVAVTHPEAALSIDPGVSLKGSTPVRQRTA